MPQAKIGLLVPLRSDFVVDKSISEIPILEGVNVIGRNNLNVSDKRVSRKHVSLQASPDGSSELVVEGSNPLVLKSGNQRKKLYTGEKAALLHGDILELVPGSHCFKYELVCVDHASSSNPSSNFTFKGKRTSVDEALQIKKHRQADGTGAIAVDFQGEHQNISVMRSSSISSCSQSELATNLDSCNGLEVLRQFHFLEDIASLTFRLMQVKGLPSWVNSSSVTIKDVIQGDVLVAILSNYMVDIDWLLSACPAMKRIPHVLVVHGESGAAVEHIKKTKPPNWILHKPSLPISYGTHHSKAMLLIYPKGLRVVVHTANLIFVDWNNKTQGLWMQDFPWKDQNSGTGSPFENDLVDYLSMLKWPEFSVNLPNVGHININASFFRKFDYSNAAVRLIASVPGYHIGPNLKKWGHMKVRSILEEFVFDKEFHKSPLIYQFSSLGSLDEKWLSEFSFSMSSGVTHDKSPLGIGKPLIIWPTVEDVRCSLEGYAAGSCIPSPQKNVEKDVLNKYWAKWKATHVGRCRAMPHIKTYTRYNGQNLAWFLLTSANLSKAAWGALQKNNSQLMIRSYELGVLFLPTTVQRHGSVFSCTANGKPEQGERVPPKNGDTFKSKLVTLCWKENGRISSSTEAVQLPVPYQLPPQPYTHEDVPWSWDRRYTKKDVYGRVWP
ncbi:tyrosyl-DNA phosphodiesterase 1 isoform X2 [Dioscorea cayenensis subsp. rotundata]|uniref:Tyrosyl-DNA phosphodiesterase 1 isoform X2 n=1 Tax=Dioscorea cayennensis subsp. rotundata TaxID=55577 RepID=A0AB40AYD5_DIOCR|nr:tyrosyl-DNA phosphodiesterase 1 isoform X2 [Dioscorea cayenensis subsp. rotundata]